MLTVYTASEEGLHQVDLAAGAPVPVRPAWIDLLNPTPEEDHAVEQALGIGIPSRAEMEEIEVSSRLYQESGALYMTALVLHQTETDSPQTSAVTFILAGRRLVTVRYAEPQPFTAFISRVQRPVGGYASGETVLLGLLDAIIERIADILERVGSEVDGISREVFAYSSGPSRKGQNFQEVLRHIGRKGDLTSKVRESLVSLIRLLTFLQAASDSGTNKELRSRTKTLNRDVLALADHLSFLSGKITFLLDASLGMINIEQNAIIKIFSVAAVVFLPPTLIASIYGMNFQHMPELSWYVGYPMAIGMMIVSAVLPYWYFKRRGWL